MPQIYFRPYLPEISRKTYIHIYTYVIFLWFHSYTSGIPCIYWHKRRSGLVVPMMNQTDEKDITTTTTYSIGKSFPFFALLNRIPFWTSSFYIREHYSTFNQCLGIVIKCRNFGSLKTFGFYALVCLEVKHDMHTLWVCSSCNFLFLKQMHCEMTIYGETDLFQYICLFEKLETYCYYI